MQRVNQAYSERNLLELLQLQLEMEHINASTLETLSADRLKHYNQVLTEQLDELELEVLNLELSFRQQFNLEPFDELSVQNLPDIYQHQLDMLNTDIEELSVLHEQLKDPKVLKSWLKQLRQYQKTMEFDETLFDDFPDTFFR
ncbi:hypothetical protein D3C72_1429750 [compost metagenome]|jgi:hypothetical protein